MSALRWIQAALVILLILLMRQLVWCLRCLWRHARGLEMLSPLPFLPRRSGRQFARHVAAVREQSEERDTLP